MVFSITKVSEATKLWDEVCLQESQTLRRSLVAAAVAVVAVVVV